MYLCLGRKCWMRMAVTGIFRVKSHQWDALNRNEARARSLFGVKLHLVAPRTPLAAADEVEVHITAADEDSLLNAQLRAGHRTVWEEKRDSRTCV
ncbi:unnamed protein product [Darwinula stevensoni]|uniref:Uncharacterized protein n=1 Tax=Darwinula stevensoni TaxID=69355 RepID=A0A7R8ZZL9_9CRUS|nr:unnamed protein product [Darwinula stevensoni]CAG0879075.1 unnamed protein product [Darwinula stevensoni]